MLATRKEPLQPLLIRKRRKPFRRGLPYRGASIPRRDPPGRSPLSLRCGSGLSYRGASIPRRDPPGRSPLRHFLGGLNLVQMWPPHNELPLIVEGVGGITPPDIPPIPPLYSQRGNSRSSLCFLAYARRPFPRGLPYSPQRSPWPIAAVAVPVVARRGGGGGGGGDGDGHRWRHRRCNLSSLVHGGSPSLSRAPLPGG
jgi:hypothetical protein